MLVFNSVVKSFPSGSAALKNISFDIAEGEFVFLTGPSGAGKTTLMRLLTANTTPSEGEILFQNKNILNLKSKDLYKHKRQVGVVFQDYKLLNELNAWENIALALEILGKKQSQIEQRVTDLLKLVNLTDKAFLFPSQLSGGEAQRISIARALASAPSLIFADEPTGNLDPDNSLAIIRLLKKINDLGTTIIVATHNQDLLKQFDKVRHIHLENGKIVVDTGTEKIKSKTKKIKKENPSTPSINSGTTEDDKTDKKEEKVKKEKTKKPRISLPKIRFFGQKSNPTQDEALKILEETAKEEEDPGLRRDDKKSKKDKTMKKLAPSKVEGKS